MIYLIIVDKNDSEFILMTMKSIEKNWFSKKVSQTQAHSCINLHQHVLYRIHLDHSDLLTPHA